MEVCFVDVAQGTSNVVLIGDRRAIVIDCGGEQSATLLSVLRRFSIDTICRLIVSHSHDDHSGGAATLLTAFQGRIDELWMLDDVRRSTSLFGQRVLEELRNGRIDPARIRRLERDERPHVIFREGPIILSLISPNFATNLLATDPNQTSAILVLKRGKQQVLFASDSTIGEWREVMRLRGTPFHCSLITVPHHAGAMWESQTKGEPTQEYEARIQADLDWLYSDAIIARFGIISVGTNNQHRHPRPEVLEAMRRFGILPICTQMTRQCYDDLEVQRARSLPMIHPSRSVVRQDLSASGNSRNVACKGTVLAEVREDEVVIHRLAEHQTMIDQLAVQHGGTPLCRAASP